MQVRFQSKSSRSKAHLGSGKSSVELLVHGVRRKHL